MGLTPLLMFFLFFSDTELMTKYPFEPNKAKLCREYVGREQAKQDAERRKKVEVLALHCHEYCLKVLLA